MHADARKCGGELTKAVDCPRRLLTVSHCQPFTGASLQCYKCHGSTDDCNSVTAKTTACLPGQDFCNSLMITKDGETSVVLGCGNENDCTSGDNACVDAEKNVRTTCESKCCQSNNCNTPPAKGTVNLNQV